MCGHLSLPPPSIPSPHTLSPPLSPRLPFQDDGKGYVAHQFGGPGESPYYMMSLPNGVSSESGGGDPAMLPGHSLPNTAWGGAGDVGMAEGTSDDMLVIASCILSFMSPCGMHSEVPF